MIGKAKSFYDDEQLYLHVPRNEDFKTRFKKAIPYRYRRWNDEWRMWEIRKPYIREALWIASRFFEIEVFQLIQINDESQSPRTMKWRQSGDANDGLLWEDYE